VKLESKKKTERSQRGELNSTRRAAAAEEPELGEKFEEGRKRTKECSDRRQTNRGRYDASSCLETKKNLGK